MRFAPLALAALAASCATAPPEPYAGEMEYDCAEKLSSPLGEFFVEDWQISWTMTTSEGGRAHATYQVNLDPTDGEQQSLFPGFATPQDHRADPTFLVGFDNAFTRPDWLGKYRSHIVEIGFGEHVFREKVLSWASSGIHDADVRTLFASDVPVVAALLDENGTMLYSFTVTHAQLMVVDQTLRDLQQRVLANLADPATRCRLVPAKPDVVII